jgi:hypothetical protein
VAVLEEDPGRLGRVFARHAYGMRRWVDLFSRRVPATDDLAAKQLLAELVADNARHMNLFRARAHAHAVDPDRYRAPREGEVIYERIDELQDLPELAGYASGSLGHFAQLLDAYAVTASGDDARVIAGVRSDVERMRERLTPLAAGGEDSAAEAHELYRRRELAETGRYADER